MFHKSLWAMALFCVTCSALFADHQRIWTDATGQHKIVGTLVEVSNIGVLLKEEGGGEKLIAIDWLSSLDRQYAKDALEKRNKELRKLEMEPPKIEAMELRRQFEKDALERRKVVFGKKIKAVWPAQVVAITDGDTVTVLNESNQQVKVRLEAIDTPEKAQPFGQKAKETLGQLLKGRAVVILETGKDRYRRTLGFVELLPAPFNEGAIANAEMIRLGFAWHYKKYNRDANLSNLEVDARAASRGLWAASAEPVAPWDWRKQKKAMQKKAREKKAKQEVVDQKVPKNQ